MKKKINKYLKINLLFEFITYKIFKRNNFLNT